MDSVFYIPVRLYYDMAVEKFRGNIHLAITTLLEYYPVLGTSIASDIVDAIGQGDCKFVEPNKIAITVHYPSQF